MSIQAPMLPSSPAGSKARTYWSIGRRIALLELASALPMLVLAISATIYLAGATRKSLRTELQFSARTMLNALDAHLARHIAIAQVLAVSPLLMEDDLSAFRVEAGQALPDISDTWLAVSDARGQQLMNLAALPGKQLPIRNPAALHVQNRSFTTGAVQISGVFQGAIRGDWIATVDFPVFRNSQPFRVLSIIMSARGIQKLFGNDPLPEGWLSAIIDAKGNFLARTFQFDRYVGQPASEGWRANMDHEGIFQFSSLEGNPIVQANEISSISGWSVGMAVNKDVLDAPVWRTVGWAVVIGTLVSGLGIFLAFAVARRIISPLHNLERSAVALVGGQSVTHLDAPPEIERVWHALQSAVADRTLGEKRQQMLIDELNHRVKNNLAIVQSIATQTLRSAGSPAEFTAAFSSRLVSLASAHNLLTMTAWEGASLMEIVKTGMAPFASPENADVISISGPDVFVPANATITVSLMLHELATNAVKYGALSQSGGQLKIGWILAATGYAARVELHWQEQGVPVAAPPTRRGFGSRLLQMGAVQLGGTSTTEFLTEGLQFRLSFPLRV